MRRARAVCGGEEAPVGEVILSGTEGTGASTRANLKKAQRFFWPRLFESSAGQELRNSHPGLRHKTPAELECTVPCVLHQDAGPFSKRRSTVLVSWSSILGFGTDITTKYGISSYIKNAG